MIQRRHFLTALGATCLASSSLAKQANAAVRNLEETDLNWRSEVIQTVPHNKAFRRPVVTGVALQPAGNQLAIVGDDHHVGIYDTKKREYQTHVSAHTDWIRSAKYSPDGKILATASNDRTLKIWDTSDWDFPIRSKNHRHAVIGLAYSADGSKIATVGFEKTLRIYSASSAEELQALECPCPDNHAVAFNADQRLIAAGGRCGTIRVWEVQTGRQVANFKAHRKRIRSIEFTDTGSLVSAADDQMIRITDLKNTRQAVTLPRHASKLYSTSLMSDGLLATGGSDNKIHVWQMSSQKEVGTLKGHTGTVSCLDFSGSKLVSGSYDTQVRLWHTESYTSAPEQRHTRLQGGWNGRLK